MAEIKVEMSIYKQREADSKIYGFSTPSFSVPRHKPMFIPNRSLDGIVFGKMPIQHRGTMPSKPAPIRRTESPKGASPNSRRRGGRRTTNLRNTIVQGRPRRGRISVSQTGSCVSTDGRPLRGRSFRCWVGKMTENALMTDWG